MPRVDVIISADPSKEPGRRTFPYAKVKTEVELTLLSTSETVETESSLSDVYKRAKQVGLELCPAEVGPQLRLH
jgi:hypothetical protein